MNDRRPDVGAAIFILRTAELLSAFVVSLTCTPEYNSAFSGDKALYKLSFVIVFPCKC